MSKQQADDVVTRVALLSADFGAASDEIDAAAAQVFGVNRTDLRGGGVDLVGGGAEIC